MSLADRDALARQDALLLAQPLRQGPEPHSMAAHLRRMVHLLRSDAPSPCGEAVTYLTALYDRSIAPHHAIACRMGCAHCCVQTVLVTAAEAFALAAALGERGPAIAAALQAAPARRLGEPRDAWRRCILLDAANGCSLYAARPLACHSFVSFDVESCIGFFARKEESLPQSPIADAQMATLCRMMLGAAHLLTGHGEQRGYELGAALDAVLRTPDAQARWRTGEDVLAGVQTGPPIPDYFTREIAAMTAFVAPTL